MLDQRQGLEDEPGTTATKIVCRLSSALACLEGFVGWNAWQQGYPKIPKNPKRLSMILKF